MGSDALTAEPNFSGEHDHRREMEQDGSGNDNYDNRGDDHVSSEENDEFSTAQLTNEILPTNRKPPLYPQRTQPVPVYRISRPAHPPQYAIWDPKDVMYLRKTHRLFGDFVGTLPKHISQNQFLTLPLMLNDEEVRRGLSCGAITLLNDGPDFYAPPTPEQVRAFKENREADISKQVEAVVLNQREERLRRTGAGTAKKRKWGDRDLDDMDIVTSPLRRDAPEEDRVSDALVQVEPVAVKEGEERKRDGRGTFTNPIQLDTSQADAREASLRPTETTAVVEDDEPPRKTAKTSLFSRFSHAVRSLVQAITVFPYAEVNTRIEAANTQAVPNGDINTSMQSAVHEEERVTPTSEKEELAKIPARLDDGPLPGTEEWREQAREKVLDTKARKQAHQSSIVTMATEAREDEIGPRGIASAPKARYSVLRARARQAVFNDLHRRGYYLTCGAKFGADFLAYAGNPQLFHAALAVIVTEGEADIPARDVVALGRLGDATRKRTVLAWVQNTEVGGSGGFGDGCVCYVGVQWEETLP